MKQRLKYSLYILLAVAAVSYGADDMVARFRTDRFGTVKVDRVYAVTNRWNIVDYSMGTPINERCVNALFPHSGSEPCWYLNSHSLHYVKAGN